MRQVSSPRLWVLSLLENLNREKIEGKNAGFSKSQNEFGPICSESDVYFKRNVICVSDSFTMTLSKKCHVSENYSGSNNSFKLLNSISKHFS